jgi:hypothetical protein
MGKERGRRGERERGREGERERGDWMAQAKILNLPTPLPHEL